MFSFAYPKLLLLLLLVPAFIVLYAWARYARRKNLNKFGQLRVLTPLMPEVSPYKPPHQAHSRDDGSRAVGHSFCPPVGWRQG